MFIWGKTVIIFLDWSTYSLIRKIWQLWIGCITRCKSTLVNTWSGLGLSEMAWAKLTSKCKFVKSLCRKSSTLMKHFVFYRNIKLDLDTLIFLLGLLLLSQISLNHFTNIVITAPSDTRFMSLKLATNTQ